METSEAIGYKHSFDLVFKLIAKVFTGKTLAVLGVKSGKIVEVRGLEPVTLQAKEERVDLLLKDEKDCYYHLEEERNLALKDLYRFAAQHFLIAENLGSDVLTSVLVVSGEVTPKTAIETNSGRYTPMIVNLNERDGEKKLAELKQQQQPDAVELVFLPMYGVKSGKRQEFAGEVLLYAVELYKAKKISLELVGAIVLLCNKVIDKETLKQIWRELSMLKVFQYAEEIGKEMGKEIGKEIGKEMGKEMGKEIGKEIGTRKATQEHILDILEARFNKVPDKIASRVFELEDINELRSLHKKAVTIPGLEEFAKLLTTPE